MQSVIGAREILIELLMVFAGRRSIPLHHKSQGRNNAMQVYGLRLVGLVQASQPSSNGGLGGSQHVSPEQLREVVYAAASSALQCVVFDAAVLSDRQGTGAVVCCRQSCHCRGLHEGVTVEVTIHCAIQRTGYGLGKLGLHETCLGS